MVLKIKLPKYIFLKMIGTASLLLCGLAACVSEKNTIQSNLPSSADTLKIAVLPFVYTGLQQNEEALTYSSGLRIILGAYLDAHPQLQVFDRERIRRQIVAQQVLQFNGMATDFPLIEGADYLILGTYQTKNAGTFRGIELRLVKVESGLIIAQKHVSDIELSAYDLGIFINGFGEIVRQKLNLPPMGDAAAYLPCRNAGWKPFLNAQSLLDVAESIENPRQKAAKRTEAKNELRKSAPAFCSLGKQFIEKEIESILE
jgi:TolB-like protein